MQGFANEAGNTLCVEERTTTYQAHIYKAGAGDGWSSSQLPINLTKATYQFDVELTASSTGHVMIGFAPEGTNLLTTYVGSVANTWSYHCHNGYQYTSGAASGFGPSTRTGDKVTMKFSFEDTRVKVFKNDALMGYINDIPFQNNNIRFFVSLHHPGEHVKARVVIST
eukprot:Phypoly_transcript_10522.p2 GENE.Phypoly_transcript_10522~~Phypoly_transcript_10522.p2  ORF type:complete len:168 (+),score=15.90 Phypoly_transcript_10522:579-1082(+)